ncbi:MAG: hypothetical protein DHS20C17_34240 [Cyclobacteriaceae bacterium]|nr:MAG: hypothetical protein DHS20C17_34240 [Cyclobacteriaceae bacterium]
MVALIEKELRTKDKELKELLRDLSIDTTSGVSSKVNSITAEKEMLHKLLNKQRLQRRKSLFALENALLLFAIAMFGVLGSFVFYLVSGASAIQGTWEQAGSEMAVLVLLLVMTTMSSVLYFQHYKHKP